MQTTGGQTPAVGSERAQTPGGSGIPVLPILGFAAAGLAILCAVYFGPDLVRYLKIERM